MHNLRKIYISSKISHHVIIEIVTTIKDKFTSTSNINQAEIFVTNDLIECEEIKNHYHHKIILLSQIDQCSISCLNTKELIDYLLTDDYNLGLTYTLAGTPISHEFQLHKLLRSWSIKYNSETVDYLRIEDGTSPQISSILTNTLNINLDVLSDLSNQIVIKDIIPKNFYLLVTSLGKFFVLNPTESSDNSAIIQSEMIKKLVSLIVSKSVSGAKYAYQIFEVNFDIEKKLQLSSLKIILNDSQLSWEYYSAIRPIFSKIRLVTFENTTDRQIDELLQLTTNHTIMENIGRGELWDRIRIQNLIKDSKQDANILIEKRSYFNWLVCLKFGQHRVVGFVSLRPMTKYLTSISIGKSDLQIRIFTYPSQGYGTNIIKAITKFIKKTPFTLWAIIHEDNQISINFFKKNGWTPMGKIKISGVDNIVFKY